MDHRRGHRCRPHRRHHGHRPLGGSSPLLTSEITLARLRWGSDLGGFRRGGFSSAWNHDYPRAEQHLSLIIKDITFADIRTDAEVIVKLDDPALFNYPIALMWEPGFWNLTDREAESFRAYLLKGGFAIFEDFDGARTVERVRVADAPRAAGRHGSSSSRSRIPSSTRSSASRTSTPSCIRCTA